CLLYVTAPTAIYPLSLHDALPIFITPARMAMPNRGQNRPLVSLKDSKMVNRFSATITGTVRLNLTASQNRPRKAARAPRKLGMNSQGWLLDTAMAPSAKHTPK